MPLLQLLRRYFDSSLMTSTIIRDKFVNRKYLKSHASNKSWTMSCLWKWLFGLSYVESVPVLCYSIIIIDKNLGESKLMPTVNYLRVTGCEHDAANWNETYRKGHRNGKTKFMKAYLYTNQLK